MNNGNIGLLAEEFSTFRTWNESQDFESLLERRINFKETFPNKEGGKAAWVESSNGHVKLEKYNFDTIWSVKCTYIVQKKLSKYKARSSEAESNKFLTASARERLANEIWNFKATKKAEDSCYGIENKTSC